MGKPLTRHTFWRMCYEGNSDSQFKRLKLGVVEAADDQRGPHIADRLRDSPIAMGPAAKPRSNLVSLQLESRAEKVESRASDRSHVATKPCPYAVTDIRESLNT